MEDLIDKGLARSIGLSNFNCQAIMDIVKYARIRPVVNQVSENVSFILNYLYV